MQPKEVRLEECFPNTLLLNLSSVCSMYYLSVLLNLGEETNR